MSQKDPDFVDLTDVFGYLTVVIFHLGFIAKEHMIFSLQDKCVDYVFHQNEGDSKNDITDTYKKHGG